MRIFAALIAVSSMAHAAEPVPYDGHYTKTIIPTPQQVTYEDAYVSLDGALVVVEADTPLLRLAAGELALNGPTIAAPDGAETVITIGVGDAPDQPEGYAIDWTARDGRAHIRCMGRDEIGAYWGVQSLLQLIDGDQLRLATIRDFPRFPMRIVQSEGLKDFESYERALSWMPRYKLNYLAFGQNYFFPADWRVWTPEQQDTIRRVCNLARDMGTVNVMFHLHPHRRTEANIAISDDADVARLAEIGLFALDEGAGSLMLRSDDIFPFAEADKAAFADQAEAHAHLINELLARIRPRYPNAPFVFCPPYYQGNGTGLGNGRPERETYLRKLGGLVPQEVHIMWTGAVTRSLEITRRETDGFARVLGRSPYLWDNTLYAHRSRHGYDSRHPHYLFDAFQTIYPKRFWRDTPGIAFNGGIAETYRVARINTADYFWNPDAYDPEASLRNALANVGGPELVDSLLDLRDAYYDVFDGFHAQKGVRLSENEELTAAADRAFEALREVEASCANTRLVDELSREVGWANARASASATTLAELAKLRESMVLDLQFADLWVAENQGEWTTETDGDAVTISFPFRTRGEVGSHGAVSREIHVPESPTGKMWLIFSASDDYTTSGTPPNAWPGFLFKQVLVDGEVIWQDDVEGNEPIRLQALQCVDLTERLAGKETATLTFRVADLGGVGNMGTVAQFSNAALVGAEPVLIRELVEMPGDEPLGDPEGFTVVSRFTMGPVGERQALFMRGAPYQYFAYVNEAGQITAGVFAQGVECSVTTETRVTEGETITAALVYDGAQARVYVDGELAGEVAAPGPIDYVAGTIHIGSYYSDGIVFKGTIHETRIYSRPLADLALLTDAGLEGRWVTPTSIDTFATDLSGNGKNGSILREWVAR